MSAQAADNLPIERPEGETRGRHVIRREDAEAEMTCSRSGKAIIIIGHKAVPAAMRGRSAGTDLVKRAVRDAASFRSAPSPRHGSSVLPNGRTCRSTEQETRS